MWVITHTATGLALGAVLVARDVPLWAIVAAALVLHVLLDIVPHWDYTRTHHRTTWALADVTVSAAILVAARTAAGAEWAVVLAGFVSALPDLDVLNAFWPTQRRIRFFPSHWTSFPHGSAPPLAGTLVQALVVAVSVAVFVIASS